MWLISEVIKDNCYEKVIFAYRTQLLPHPYQFQLRIVLKCAWNWLKDQLYTPSRLHLCSV